VAEIKEILNKLGEDEDEKSIAIMKNHFANACKNEYLFCLPVRFLIAP